MSVIAQYAPYALREARGTTTGRARRRCDAVVGALDGSRRASASSSALARSSRPLDLERDYGLTGGHPLHGEPGLDQFFLWRPLLGHARYRLPIEGLYLCGLRRPPRRRHHRRPGPERGARDPRATLKRAAAERGAVALRTPTRQAPRSTPGGLPRSRPRPSRRRAGSRPRAAGRSDDGARRWRASSGRATEEARRADPDHRE